ncbi:Hypothetical protein SMAX5B_007364 [Scophthalmus maximus]|uniref:Uncharacterized protein n=1 Tax=Scophthalmus maximus TaxID=52904 RepID=A0A2U9BRG5_SCOMX|nr:Hypothetical protein SMAX5B_007364 [Scophthalmus maximus]
MATGSEQQDSSPRLVRLTSPPGPVSMLKVEPPERPTPERRGVQGNATGTFTLPGWYTSSQAARVERNAPGEYDTDLNHGQDCGSNPDLTQSYLG